MAVKRLSLQRITKLAWLWCAISVSQTACSTPQNRASQLEASGDLNLSVTTNHELSAVEQSARGERVVLRQPSSDDYREFLMGTSYEAASGSRCTRLQDTETAELASLVCKRPNGQWHWVDTEIYKPRSSFTP